MSIPLSSVVMMRDVNINTDQQFSFNRSLWRACIHWLRVLYILIDIFDRCALARMGAAAGANHFCCTRYILHCALQIRQSAVRCSFIRHKQTSKNTDTPTCSVMTRQNVLRQVTAILQVTMKCKLIRAHFNVFRNPERRKCNKNKIVN